MLYLMYKNLIAKNSIFIQNNQNKELEQTIIVQIIVYRSRLSIYSIKVDWRKIIMNIIIEKLKVTDIENLYEFEIENRTFSRKWYRLEEMIITYLRFLK